MLARLARLGSGRCLEPDHASGADVLSVSPERRPTVSDVRHDARRLPVCTRPVSRSDVVQPSCRAIVHSMAGALCVKWIFEIGNNRHVTVMLRPIWVSVSGRCMYTVVLASWIYLLIYRREDDFASTWLGQLLHLFQ